MTHNPSISACVRQPAELREQIVGDFLLVSRRARGVGAARVALRRGGAIGRRSRVGERDERRARGARARERAREAAAEVRARGVRHDESKSASVGVRGAANAARCADRISENLQKNLQGFASARRAATRRELNEG